MSVVIALLTIREIKLKKLDNFIAHKIIFKKVLAFIKIVVTQYLLIGYKNNL